VSYTLPDAVASVKRVQIDIGQVLKVRTDERKEKRDHDSVGSVEDQVHEHAPTVDCGRSPRE
jgi:hypothetical protein